MGERPRRGLGQLLRFAAVGSFNTVLDFVLLFTLVYAAGLNQYLGNVVSTGICLVVSFFLNRQWTFRSSQRSTRQFLTFLAVTLAGLWGVQSLLLWGVHVALRPVAEGPVALFIAKAIATLGSLTWNYLLYSRLVFRD